MTLSVYNTKNSYSILTLSSASPSESVHHPGTDPRFFSTAESAKAELD